MTDEYAVIAPFYDRLGMATFAEMLTPTIMDYAQAHDWVGRRAVDLGCGTGASVRWFANHGYNITGVDLSPSMLRVAQQSISGSGISFQLFEGDIRALSDLHDIDLALALDVLNDLNSLRDLEAFFNSVAQVLAQSKLLVFDMYTIEGLAERNNVNAVISDTDDLSVFLTNRFDFDRQACAASHVIFERESSGWQRLHTTRTLRGFPIQVVTALLQRAGFGIMALLNNRFENVDPAAMREPRVIVFAKRA